MSARYHGAMSVVEDVPRENHGHLIEAPNDDHEDNVVENQHVSYADPVERDHE